MLSRLLSTDGEQKVVLEKAGLNISYAFISQRGCACCFVTVRALSPVVATHPALGQRVDLCMLIKLEDTLPLAQVLSRSSSKGESGAVKVQ